MMMPEMAAAADTITAQSICPHPFCGKIKNTLSGAAQNDPIVTVTKIDLPIGCKDFLDQGQQLYLLCSLLQFELYRVYSDPGVSAKNLKRPGIQAMIRDMKAGKFDTLLIHKLDRLSRNLGDLYAFIEMINKLNIRLIIASQGSEEIDTKSPMGKAFLYFSGIWAQIYLENLREETLKGLTKKIQKGGRHMSRPPLGYEFDENMNLVIVEEEAELVRMVYDLYLNKGWGVTKIAKHMNTFSCTKEGGKWDSKTVRNILTNPTYAGYNHFKPADWPEESRIITEGNHPPIVSKEDFARVQQYRERRKKGRMSRRASVYPYSGILKCGNCGANYIGNQTKSKSNGKVYRNYRCLNNYLSKTCDAPSISEAKLNSILFSHIELIDDGVKEKKEKKKIMIDLQKEIEKSNRRRKNWMMALGDGKLSADDYAMLIEEEEARMKEIYEQLKESEEQSIPTDELQKMVRDLFDNWNDLTAETQKQLIQSMFQRITIKQEADEWRIIDFLTV